MSPSLDWMDKALCANHPNPDIFFPTATGKAAIAQAREAALVCMRCPVQPECREHRTITGASTGVWGSSYRTTKAHQRSVTFNHGRESGYKKHLQLNEPPCLPCRRAHSRRCSTNAQRVSRQRPEIAEKRCQSCDAVKPVSDFYRDNTIVDGYKSRCKVCYRERRRGWAS